MRGRTSIPWLPPKGGVNQSVRIYYSYKRTMSELAAELGYSVLFPTDCRYCGQRIYLFASPEGGFAIFDEVGIPWPKHQCWGIRSNSRDYRGNKVYSDTYRVPIERELQAIRTRGRGLIIGFCVDQVIGLSLPAYLLWDGRGLLRVVSEEKLEKGRLYQGNLNQDGEFCWLVQPELIEYIPSEPVYTRHDNEWEVNEVWYLQQDAADMLISEREIKQGLLASIDAIVSENEIIAALILVNLSATPAFSLTKKRRDFYRALGLQLFEAYGLKLFLNCSFPRNPDASLRAVNRIQQILSDSRLFVERLNLHYRIDFEGIIKSLVPKLEVR